KARERVRSHREGKKELGLRGRLPAQRFLEKRDGQFALGLQGGLIELFEEFEQRAHAARAAGKDEAADLVVEVQATARGAQLQGAQLVFIGQFLELEHQRQGQARLQIGQLNAQFAG